MDTLTNHPLSMAGVKPISELSSHELAGDAMANITYDTLIISHQSELLRRLGRTLARWWRRSRERGELARFDGRSLRDIGLTPAEAAYEINKPFWRD
jgi:uncharacterized protein YjiS (DUF1127 family)